MHLDDAVRKAVERSLRASRDRALRLEGLHRVSTAKGPWRWVRTWDVVVVVVVLVVVEEDEEEDEEEDRLRLRMPSADADRVNAFPLMFSIDQELAAILLLKRVTFLLV